MVIVQTGATVAPGLPSLADRLVRLPAILCAFPAHLRAQLAMLMIVARALSCASVADARTQLQHLADDLLVLTRPPKRNSACRLANVGAIQAHTDALLHVHCLGGAGVGAAQAHLRTIHKVVDGIPERLIDVTLHIGVKGDHLADGHWFLLLGGKANVLLERWLPPPYSSLSVPGESRS
jgi:hypothetical protein